MSPLSRGRKRKQKGGKVARGRRSTSPDLLSGPEHCEQMEWLGLEDPGDLDPARFDADQVTGALARLR